MESDYSYPVTLNFGYQQRVLAVDKEFKNKLEHKKYRKYLSDKYNIPNKRLLEWRSD